MLAYFLERNDTPARAFTLRETEKPGVGEGEIRIKVRAFGLNYADIMARQGLYRECPPLPAVIGYDVEGIVEEVGQGVHGFKKGDPVFALTRFGGYAQYVTTRHEAVALLPSHAAPGEGCALATQYITAYHAVVHCQELMPGEKVLVHAAAGGLGTALVQIALSKGCIVIGVVGGHKKAEYIRAMGVQHVIDHTQTDYIEYIAQHLGGRVDVVIDNVGGSSLKKGKKILSRGGRIVTLGAAALSGKKGYFSLIRLFLGFGFFSPVSYLSQSQALIGVNMLKIADHRPDIIERELKGVVNLYRQGIFKPHIGKIFPQHELPQAHAWMEDRKSIGKIIVAWDDF